MKKVKFVGVLTGTLLVLLAGCSKKQNEETAPPPTPPPATNQPAASATNQSAAAPATPYQVPQASYNSPSSAPSQPQGTAQDQDAIDASLAKSLQKVQALPQPKTEQERFQRNITWIATLKNGSEEKKQEAIQQIRAAHLSGQEMNELQKLAKMYNVKF